MPHENFPYFELHEKDRKSNVCRTRKEDYKDIYLELKNIAWKLYDLTCDFRQLQFGAETIEDDDDDLNKIFCQRFEQKLPRLNIEGEIVLSPVHDSKNYSECPEQEEPHDQVSMYSMREYDDDRHDDDQDESISDRAQKEKPPPEYDVMSHTVDEIGSGSFKQIKERQQKTNNNYANMSNKELEDELRKRELAKKRTQGKGLRLPPKPYRPAKYSNEHSCKEVKHIYDRLQSDLNSKINFYKLNPRVGLKHEDNNVFIIDTKNFKILAFPRDKLGIGM